MAVTKGAQKTFHKAAKKNPEQPHTETSEPVLSPLNQAMGDAKHKRRVEPYATHSGNTRVVLQFQKERNLSSKFLCSQIHAECRVTINTSQDLIFGPSFRLRCSSRRPPNIWHFRT